SGDATRELAAQFLALAEKRQATVPIIIGNRLLAHSLLLSGEIAECRACYDKALALYDPIEHRVQAMRFAMDHRVSVLGYRPTALLALGYPDAALVDTQDAVRYARETSHAGTLMHALASAGPGQMRFGNYAVANTLLNELSDLANKTGSSY